MKKGDRVKCKGIGYPQWKDMEFTVEVVFPDNIIKLDNKIRVGASDFEVVPESIDENPQHLENFDDDLRMEGGEGCGITVWTVIVGLAVLGFFVYLVWCIYSGKP